MLTLYALPQSPYCAKVRAALRFKGMGFEEVEPHGGSYQTTEFQSVFPAGSVPAIAEGDWLLHDSQAILEYLEEVQPNPSIWHADKKTRAVQRSIVLFHDSKLEPKVRELVPLAMQPDSPERTLQVGVVRDNVYDCLYRLVRLMALDKNSFGATMSAIDWTLPPTVAIAKDVLDHLDSSLDIPEPIARWLDETTLDPLVAEEVDRVRGAIAQWLRNILSQTNQS